MKEKNEKQTKKTEHDIEIVYETGSNLDISDVNDCMNNLRPKIHTGKKPIIPKPKKKK